MGRADGTGRYATRRLQWIIGLDLVKRSINCMTSYSKLLLIVTLTALRAQAQFAAPVKDAVSSEILREKRNIEIILPANYASDTAACDVWYVIDGEWNTKTFTDIFSFLAAIGFAPPVIIVGVPNRYVNGFNLRDRDFTPTRFQEVDSSGGAGPFLDFFEKELMPYIQKKYRTSGESGLFGTSLGGLFAFYVLLERPSLFRFYTLADPAFQFDNNYLPQLAAQRLRYVSFANTVLNIGGRSGFSYQAMGRDIMDSILRADAPAGLHWHSALYDDETHGSSVFKSNYDGIKYAYLGYYRRQARFHLTGGVVLKDRPVRLFVPTDHADMHYTVNGTIPTTSDPKVDEYLLVGEPEKLRVKSFSPSGRYDHVLPMGLRSGDYWSPRKMPVRRAASNLPPAKKLNGKFRDDGARIMDGVVTVPKDGYYVLQLTPSAGTQLFFNDSLLVDAGASMGHDRQTIILPLRVGDYPLRLLHPSKDSADPPIDLGFYYSVNGQDDWWRNPVVKW